ncbi:serine hydrolase domain-containing protein [Sphingomonas jatrophae]|nr:serine hydrolase domain-containing protein [Sphingomonas jatrophae]
MNEEPAVRGGADRTLLDMLDAESAPKGRIWTPAVSLVALGMIVLVLLVFATIGRSYTVRAAPQVTEPAPAQAAIVEVASQGPSRNGVDYRRIDSRLTQLMDRKDMVGLGVAIIEDGRLSFVKGYGRTTEGGEAVTPNTVFRWASVSKGVAGTLMAALADQKRLSLSDPIAKFGTSLRLPNGGERIATVADLLSHRTGVVKNAYDDKLEEGIDPREIRRLLGDLPPYCPPGKCFAYQNIAYDAASEIVQHVTGKSYAEVARFRLFLPLGMTSASLTRAGLLSSASWARPHRGQRELPVQEAYYRVPAAGGMNSSTFDLGLWMRAQMGLAPGVLSQAVLDVAHNPLTLSVQTRRKSEADQQLKEASYALGWRDYRYNGHRLIGHRGAVSGYRSLILFDPDRKAGIAMLWNSESPKPVGMQLEFFDMLDRAAPRDWMKLDTK